MPARERDSIDDVLAALDGVIAQAIDAGRRIGYFAAIYRQVTARVAEGIASGVFDDAERMERFDVVFAARYLDALDAYERGDPLTASWQVTFRAAETSRPIILQHLLLAISAHINIDLGVAAATIAPGRDLPSLRRDFDLINEILAALIADIEHDLASISPLIGLLDTIGGRHDEEVIRFSIEAARSEAWRFAVELAPLAADDWAGPLRARDARVGHIARAILHPGWLSAGLLVIRAGERYDVRHNIEVLARVEPPSLAVVEARAGRQDAVQPFRPPAVSRRTGRRG